MTEEKEQLLERLFHDNYERMFRLAYALLHDYEEARDVVSEVFSKLWDRPRQPPSSECATATVALTVRLPKSWASVYRR